MTMDKHAKTLEFDKILARLVALTPTKGAKALAETLTPSPDIAVVLRRLHCTTDARRLLDVKGLPPFGDGADLKDLCDHACKGAMLSCRELLSVASAFRSARQMGDYYKENRTFDTVLDELFMRLLPNRHLEDAITKSILSEDAVADEASTGLADIRRQIRSRETHIREFLRRMISGPSSAYLQDNLVTTRDGRFVVPVKAECRNMVKGLVHDTSASGSTLFIEPMAVVEDNNELRLLHNKEEKEIEKVLYNLSSMVASSSESLQMNFENTSELAFYFGCALLSEEMDGVEAQISGNREIRLVKARHPLIPKDRVVPISLTLGNGTDTLMITGPNTGGKTVTLKTVGLLSLMTQSGLHIPASESTSLPIFDKILADIGDDQSIQQNLSTFSSHLVNIVDITEKITSRSLCLFDELGAGTDPVEGSALAQGVITYVRNKGAFCLATTHYSELKTYAMETPGVMNASCEFDVNTLKPTYRLLIGTPGKSNAFAIASRLGLKEEILDMAKSHVGTDNLRLEQVIEKLEKARLEAENEREEAIRYKNECEKMYRDAAVDIQRQNADTLRQIEENRRTAQQMLDSAKASSDFVFDRLEKARKLEEQKQLSKGLDQLRSEVKKTIKDSDDIVNPVEIRKNHEGYQLPRDLKTGDRVWLVNIGCEGEVIEPPKKDGRITVRAGAITTRTTIDNLQLLTPKKEEKKKSSSGDGRRFVPLQNFPIELDLRGCMGEEAWDKTDKYLDDAMLAGVGQVRIVHGKGTGALRKIISERLKKDKRVKSYRLGQFGEGDSGVTVVEMK